MKPKLRRTWAAGTACRLVPCPRSRPFAHRPASFTATTSTGALMRAPRPTCHASRPPGGGLRRPCAGSSAAGCGCVRPCCGPSGYGQCCDRVLLRPAGPSRPTAAAGRGLDRRSDGTWRAPVRRRAPAGQVPRGRLLPAGGGAGRVATRRSPAG
ncbi:gp41 [Stenotrophomonas phage S1]|uniref:putative MSF protein n=1 Tax=Stenotrophomonas phage S1 TaxID=573591 RepID=UPI000185A090|nr:putative MSF protein [Stenotrophomonas phage S1]ACJ24766.1 gp41 [Stenotrophomonas phage S1]